MKKSLLLLVLCSCTEILPTNTPLTKGMENGSNSGVTIAVRADTSMTEIRDTILLIFD